MYRLSIWPGFATSINLFEDRILLQADISHKILRSDTILDLMYDAINRNRVNFRNELSRKIIGQIVLTRLIYKIGYIKIICRNTISLFLTNSSNIGIIIKLIRLMTSIGPLHQDQHFCTETLM